MEQIIHTFGIDWKLLLIQVFNFALVLVALWYFLYRPLLRMIAKRKTLIDEGIQKAELANREAKLAEQKKNELLREATKEAELVVGAAKRRAEEVEKTLIADARVKEARIVKDAELRAEEEKKRLLRESEAEIARLAILAAAKVLEVKH